MRSRESDANVTAREITSLRETIQRLEGDNEALRHALSEQRARMHASQQQETAALQAELKTMKQKLQAVQAKHVQCCSNGAQHSQDLAATLRDFMTQASKQGDKLKYDSIRSCKSLTHDANRTDHLQKLRKVVLDCDRAMTHAVYERQVHYHSRLNTFF